MAVIRRGGNRQIRKNFNESELQSGSWGLYPDTFNSFHLSDNTLDALQWLRTILNTPFEVTSTARSPLHNAAEGSRPSSMHYWDSPTKIIRAIDFIPLDKDKADVLYWDLKNKGMLYNFLRKKFGLSFGLYNNFFHIDDGNGKGVGAKHVFEDKYGKFGLWDLSSKKKVSTQNYMLISKLRDMDYTFLPNIKKY